MASGGRWEGRQKGMKFLDGVRFNGAGGVEKLEFETGWGVGKR